MLLNDIYFFIQIGRVKLCPSTNLVSNPDGSYLLVDEARTFTPDVVLGSQRAQVRKIPIRYNGAPLHFEYDQFLYGNWSTEYPNLYFLGTTRPTTGAFGSMAEMGCKLVHELITNQSFKHSLASRYDALWSSWRTDSLRNPRCAVEIQESEVDCCDAVLEP